jgi:DNA polymerase-1
VQEWETELAAAQAARAAATPGMNWSRQNEKQAHIEAALLVDGDPDALDAWPRTKLGLLKTNRATLERATDIPGITEHLEVVRLAKLVSSFGHSLIVHVNPRTGRLHTSLLIAGARTSRFSSRQPNMQQLPKRRLDAFRKVIIAGPGKLLLAADYGAVELRALAEEIYAMVGESRMRDGFIAGHDPHTLTVLRITGKTDAAEVTKEERQGAKAGNFGLSYGMGKPGFFLYVRANYQKDITREASDALYDAMHSAFPELRQWQQLWAAQCRRAGYVETPLGRRWYWRWYARDEEEIDWDAGFIDDQRIGFEYTYALNHVIQGGCAEVMLLALARLDRALRPYGARIILTVHDEVLIEVADDPAVIAAVRDIVVAEMTAAFSMVFPDAPTIGLVEPTIGSNWGEQVKVDEWLAERRS